MGKETGRFEKEQMILPEDIIKKDIFEDIERWRRYPFSFLLLPHDVIVYYNHKKNVLDVEYQGMIFPLIQRSDESNSESESDSESYVPDVEVEFEKGYSVKYSPERDSLYIHYHKIGFAIFLKMVREEWDARR